MQYKVNNKEDLKNNPGFTWFDLVRQVFPKVNDQDCEHLLWGFTGYMGGNTGCWGEDDHIIACLKQLEEAKVKLKDWDGDPTIQADFKPLYDEMDEMIKNAKKDILDE